MTKLLTSPITRSLVFCLCLVPLAIIIYDWRTHQLGINWIEAAQHRTGDWVLRYLIFTLMITPLRRIPGLNALIKYRRMLGLYAFFYACVHFTVYLWYDKGLDWTDIESDFLHRRFFIAGLIALVCMVPLAITSTRSWIRRLGRRWTQLHRLVYVSAASGAIHYYLQGKSIVPRAVMYALIVAVLLVWRPVIWYLQARQRRPAPVRKSDKNTLSESF